MTAFRIIFLFFFISNTQGASVDSVTQSIQQFMLEMKKVEALSHESLGQLVDTHINPNLDYISIGQLILGKHWKRSTVNQKKQFLACFPRELRQMQIDILSSWQPNQWQIKKKSFNQNETKLALDVSLSNRHESRDFTIRLHKVDQQWLIYDTAYEGLSLLKTFKDGYAEKISRLGLKRTLSQVCDEYPEFIRDLTLAGIHWPPFIGRGLPGQGLSVELVSSVFQQAGYKTKVVIAPWKRVMEGMKSGEYDVNMAIWHSLARSEYLDFSDAYFKNRLVAVSSKNQYITSRSLDALLSYKGKMGIMDDYSYSELIQRYPNRKYFTRYSDLCRSLALNELDFALLDQSVANYHLSRSNNASLGLQVSTINLESKPLHISMLKTHPVANQVLTDFNVYLKKYLKSSEYQALLARYNLKN